MSLLTLVLRRLCVLPLLMFGLYTVVFCLVHLVPADPATALAGEGASELAVQKVRAEFGLDKPLVVQYFSNLGRILKGDLGTSMLTGRSISDDLGQFFPATIELAVASMILALVLGCALGVLSAVFKGKLLDMSATGFSVFFLAMPQFWLGMIFQIALCLALRIMPLGGRIDPSVNLHPITNLYMLDSVITANWAALGSSVRHLLLPALTLGITSLGLFSRMSRTELLNTLQADYVRTARSVGHREAAVVWRAFRNVLITIATVTGMQFGFLLGGAVAVETVFDWPGLGLYAATAALTANYPAIVALTLLFGAIRILFNLLVDVSYFVLDPRIRQ